MSTSTTAQARRGDTRSPRLLAPVFQARTYKALLFFLGELVLSCIGLVVFPVAWVVILVFAITPLSVPLLIAYRALIGGLAQAHAALARLIGVHVDAPILSPSSPSFWGRGKEVLADRSFWTQQAYTLAMFPIALLPVALFGAALQVVSVPIYYRWDQVDTAFGWDVDTLGKALLLVPVGLAIFLVAAHVTGGLARVSGWLGARLLPARGAGMARTPARRRAAWNRALSIDALVATTIALGLVVIWALTTAGYFWPIWPILALALVVGIPGWVFLCLEQPEPARLALGSKALAIQAGVSVLLFGFLVATWAVTTRGYFWPIWVALGLAVALLLHAALIYGRRKHRIERLEETRAGAVDVQETELRRIERDLHDGAQARLVAVGMSLGMAEQKLDSDPEAVRALLEEARAGAAEALEELRDLARGIHPPILTDRGLEAAIAALVARSPIPVRLVVDVPRRPSAPVETAAYFTVSEALANAIKHAHARTVDIKIRLADDVLATEITDDGRGGANPEGGGLKGLRQRIEALDGTLRVTSPDGGPTTVRAVMPCES